MNDNMNKIVNTNIIIKIKKKSKKNKPTTLNIKKSVVDTFNKNGFIYFGINLSAFTDTEGEIR